MHVGQATERSACRIAPLASRRYFGPPSSTISGLDLSDAATPRQASKAHKHTAQRSYERLCTPCRAPAIEARLRARA